MKESYEDGELPHLAWILSNANHAEALTKVQVGKDNLLAQFAVSNHDDLKPVDWAVSEAERKSLLCTNSSELLATNFPHLTKLKVLPS